MGGGSKEGARLTPYAAGTAILVVAASLNVSAYADHVQKQDLDWVYGSDLVGALQSAHAFDEPGTVYFYSNRWSYNYETRLFLYPDTPGIDRSREFGDFSILKELDEGPVTYILLPPYDQEIETLRQTVPGWRDHRGAPPGRQQAIQRVPSPVGDRCITLSFRRKPESRGWGLSYVGNALPCCA